MIVPRGIRARRRIVAAALAATAIVPAGCTAVPDPLPTTSAAGIVTDTGPRSPFVDATPDTPTIVDGDDWSLPESSRPASNSGFFSEQSSPSDLIAVRSVDVTWRQVMPEIAGPIDRDASGSAQEMEFASLDEQLSEPGDFWMRVFASGVDWAPKDLAVACDVDAYGPDDDGMEHLPIWNACVWDALIGTYRTLFVDTGLAADPRLRFVYVPGAFTWAEFDYDIIAAAVDAGDLDEQEYLAWYAHAWTDLVELFGDDAHKLVFTGEDYPFGPFGEADDLLAAQAVAAGMGIRNGITEPSNFHLSEAPAYGSHVRPDGHLSLDESLPVHSGRYVVATENECFVDCGYDTADLSYAVRQANLKALQLRVNWMYVVPEDSFLREFPDHWEWVRLSLGQSAETSSDAWAALRDAEDTYWAQDDPAPPFDEPDAWPTRPWVRNLERWLVQVDEPGSLAHRTDVDMHVGEVDPDNGTALEGLSTSVGEGDTGFVFELDDRFAAASADRMVVKVTFLDDGAGAFRMDTDAGSSALVERTGSGSWRTATVVLPAGAFAEETRLRLSLTDGADDLAVRFVRVVRVAD